MLNTEVTQEVDPYKHLSLKERFEDWTGLKLFEPTHTLKSPKKVMGGVREEVSKIFKFFTG